MVNVSNVMNSAFQAVKNNPVKTAAAVATVGLVAAGAFFRVDTMVGPAVQGAANKASELAQQFVQSDAGKYLADTTVGKWVDSNVFTWIPEAAQCTNWFFPC